MKFLVTGVTGFRNRGVEALISTALDEIASAIPDSQCTIVSSDAIYDRRAVGPAAQVIEDAPGFYRRKPANRMLRYGLGLMAPKQVAAIRLATNAADVIIASGGDIFSSDYGVGFLRRQLALLKEAQKAGRKTVLLGHSIGPFKSAAEVALAAPVLKAASLITARESYTQKYLIETFGLPPERVVLTGDVAFLMKPSASERIDGLKACMGLPPGTRYVALAPSEGITSFSNARDRNRHDEAWIETIRHVLAVTDCHVMLVPHVQDSNLSNDDNQIVFRLLEALGFPERVHAAFGCHSARDYKGLIAGAEIFVGERMHACIAALSQNVPCVVIGYSVKARGIMDDIFGAEADRMKLTVPVEDFVNVGTFTQVLDGVWRNRAHIRSLLQDSIPKIQARARKNFELLSLLSVPNARRANGA